MERRASFVLLFVALMTVPCMVQDARERSPRVGRTCSGVYDTVVRGGYVLTGDGAEAVPADVAIAGDRVACVGRVDAPGAAAVIDATDLHVTPGFVDVHSHADADIEKAVPSAAGARTAIPARRGAPGFDAADPRLAGAWQTKKLWTRLSVARALALRPARGRKGVERTWWLASGELGSRSVAWSR